VVRGLPVFQQHFAAHSGEFVLIGGTAATLAMENAGLSFRATKDLDIVLHIEALTPDFGRSFWEFVEKGRYERREANEGKPKLYRFQKPEDDTYPYMLELFSRAPEGILLSEGAELTPIPFDEAASSLSAILLNDDYYAFVMDGRRESDGLPWVAEDRLIPLKASAWLDLSARRKDGEEIDDKNIRKHARDAIRLSQLLTPDMRIDVPARVAEDLNRFIAGVASDGTYDPRTLDIPEPLDVVLQRIARAYTLV
jgi:hypothetical protein